MTPKPDGLSTQRRSSRTDSPPPRARVGGAIPALAAVLAAVAANPSALVGARATTAVVPTPSSQPSSPLPPATSSNRAAFTRSGNNELISSANTYAQGRNMWYLQSFLVRYGNFQAEEDISSAV
ncbi:uncharacterized protein [Miscanthus floridulus]|uniref:uncharacterized protein n=1 Tax=Miscanthus floridulus TaxID=154761 RepID=UPI00345931B6